VKRCTVCGEGACDDPDHYVSEHAEDDERSWPDHESPEDLALLCVEPTSFASFVERAWPGLKPYEREVPAGYQEVLDRMRGTLCAALGVEAVPPAFETIAEVAARELCALDDRVESMLHANRPGWGESSLVKLYPEIRQAKNRAGYSVGYTVEPGPPPDSDRDAYTGLTYGELRRLPKVGS
jgi:hypothetical protein